VMASICDVGQNTAKNKIIYLDRWYHTVEGVRRHFLADAPIYNALIIDKL